MIIFWENILHFRGICDIMSPAVCSFALTIFFCVLKIYEMTYWLFLSPIFLGGFLGACMGGIMKTSLKICWLGFLIGVLLLVFSFSVIAESEPNETLENADRLELNCAMGGALSDGEDIDFFFFEIVDDGELILRFSADGETSNSKIWYVRVFDSRDAEYLYARVRGGAEELVSSVGNLAPGKYYIKIFTRVSSYSPVAYSFSLSYANGHQCELEFVDRVDATCKETGLIAHWRCASCGKNYDSQGQELENVIIDLKPHAYQSEWSVDAEATCTRVGSESRHCKDCQAKTDVREIPKAEHQTLTWDPIKAPTCIEVGRSKSTCEQCRNVIYKTVAALGHAYEDVWRVDLAPTCESVGSESRHCTRCSARTDVQEIDKPAHSFDTPGFDEASHWRECACGEKTDLQAHDFQTYVLKDATCKQQGYAQYICRGCEHSYDAVIPYGEHRMGEWSTRVEATCSQNGERVRECVLGCGTVETVVLEKTEHSYDVDWTVDLTPTCMQAGSKSRHCINCDVRTEITSIPANGHSLGAWSQILAPTCTEEGREARACMRCEFVEERVGADAAGHSFGDWNELVAPTCTEKGIESRVCTACELVERRTGDAAAGHSFGEWSEIAAPTCTEKGVESRVCLACELEESRLVGEASGHHFDVYFTVDEAPSCERAGSKSRHCQGCDARIEKTTLPATGHEFGAWVTIFNITCTERGVKTRSCVACDHEESAYFGTVYGHRYEEFFTVDEAPTCDKIGSKSRHCENCDARTDETILPASGHLFGDWRPISAATCTEAAVGKRTCSVCLFEETSEVGEAAGHLFDVNYTIDHAPTCEEFGSKSRHCQRCDARTDVSEIQPAGHTFFSWQETVAPTCTEAGRETGVCIFCETEESRIGRDALGHAYASEWTVDEAPTCQAAGSKSRHCQRCDAVADQTVLAIPDHTYDEGIVTVEPTCEQTGSRVFTCTGCQHTKAISLEKLPPVILGVAEREWQPRSQECLVFRSAAMLVDFLEVRVNGEVVPRDCYNLREGSTIVELTPEYLKTLEGGSYTLEIVSTTGVASANFEVVDRGSFLWLWLVLGALMIPAVGILIWYVIEKSRKPVTTIKPVTPAKKPAEPVKQSARVPSPATQALTESPTQADKPAEEASAEQNKKETP